VPATLQIKEKAERVVRRVLDGNQSEEAEIFAHDRMKPSH